MSAGEAEETQSAYGDASGGPGAPTPLTVLDVCKIEELIMDLVLTILPGGGWLVSARYQARSRRRL